MLTIKEFDDRTECYLNGILHRNDGPACVWRNGTKEWFFHGLRHRIDGPAWEYCNGQKEWYLNGLRHRADGPALEYPDGIKLWFLNGVRHRETGPAIELYSTKEWYIHGLLHRIDGPAVERIEGITCWYLHGKRLSPQEIKAHQISRLRDICLSLLPLQLPPYVIFWILEWSESFYIADLDQRSIIKMIEGIRNSRQKLKNIVI